MHFMDNYIPVYAWIFREGSAERERVSGNHWGGSCKALRSSLAVRPQSRGLLRRSESPLWQPRKMALKWHSEPHGKDKLSHIQQGRCPVTGEGKWVTWLGRAWRQQVSHPTPETHIFGVCRSLRRLFGSCQNQSWEAGLRTWWDEFYV